jgi:hypothetical protein
MVSSDFVTVPPSFSGNDSILVFTLHHIKMGFSIPTSSKATAEEVAHVCIHNILWLHGIFQKIVSDRNSSILSNSGDSSFPWVTRKFPAATSSPNISRPDQNKPFSVILCQQHLTICYDTNTSSRGARELRYAAEL